MRCFVTEAVLDDEIRVNVGANAPLGQALAIKEVFHPGLFAGEGFMGIGLATSRTRVRDDPSGQEAGHDFVGDIEGIGARDHPVRADRLSGVVDLLQGGAAITWG